LAPWRSHQLLHILGLAALRLAGAVLVSLRPVGAALGFLGLAGAVLLVLGPSVVVSTALGPQHLLPTPKFQSADQEQMLKAFVTRGLPSLLWSAPGPAAR
jgi:membrane-bound ClpP family serine protease